MQLKKESRSGYIQKILNNDDAAVSRNLLCSLDDDISRCSRLDLTIQTWERLTVQLLGGSMRPVDKILKGNTSKIAFAAASMVMASQSLEDNARIERLIKEKVVNPDTLSDDELASKLAEVLGELQKGIIPEIDKDAAVATAIHIAKRDYPERVILLDAGSEEHKFSSHRNY